VNTEEAIAAATTAAVRMLHAPLVVVFTKSGFSARIVSSHRPAVPILALTDEPRVCRQLSLVWGVIPRLVPTARGYDHMVAMATRRRDRSAPGLPGRSRGRHGRRAVRRARHHQSAQGRGRVRETRA
jgi:pyruvate kinase